MSAADFSVRIGLWDEPDAALADRAVAWPGSIFIDHARRRVARGGVVVRFGPIQFRLVAALLARRGAIISLAEMVDAIYGGREDGGPDLAVHVVQNMLLNVQPKLAQLGLVRGRRYWFGSWIELAGDDVRVAA
jgi:DNA-binding response OmpR family regulator